jgi:hypothetical protein
MTKLPKTTAQLTGRWRASDCDETKTWQNARRDENRFENAMTVPRQTIRDAMITRVMMPPNTATARFTRAMCRDGYSNGARSTEVARQSLHAHYDR